MSIRLDAIALRQTLTIFLMDASKAAGEVALESYVDFNLLPLLVSVNATMQTLIGFIMMKDRVPRDTLYLIGYMTVVFFVVCRPNPKSERQTMTVNHRTSDVNGVKIFTGKRGVRTPHLFAV
jgi:hypothetical protein